MENFCNILQNTLSIDNNVRTQAEKQYETINLQEKTEFLTNLLSNPESVANVEQGAAILQVALVFLRKLISNDNQLYDALKQDKAQLDGFKNSILTIITKNSKHADNLKISKKLADLFSDTYFCFSETGDWPEATQLLINLYEDAATTKIALQSVLSYPAIIEPLGNGKIVNMLAKSLEDDTGKEEAVNYLAARATCSYLINFEPDDIEAIMGFGILMPQVMRIIVKSVENDDDSVIKQFIEVVECEALSPLLKSGFNDIITLSLSIISKENVEDDNKQLALEVVISLVETFPGLIRKLTTKAQQAKMDDPIEGTIQACLHFIQLIDDEDDWLTADAEDDTDIKSNSLTGEASIDRLACALRGGVVLPRITKILPSLMASPKWEQRYVGITAIAAIAEGCHAQMQKALPDVVRQVLVFTKDSHGRVRYAASNCLGQLAIDFQEKFTKLAHAEVIPALCNLLDDTDCPKVIGQAAAALVNIVESLPNSLLKQYQDTMINKIESNMNREAGLGRRYTLQQLVTLLASIAGAMDTDFIPYFEKFMPGLNQIIQNTIKTDDLTKLRGKAIECYSIIGLAVGKDNFFKYAKDFMDAMLQLQLTPEMWAEEDETISYTISAWARMSKVLGEEFSGYLPQVMPPLLQACNITPEVTMIDEEENVDLDEEKWQMVKLPGDSSHLGIKTSGLELKATACSMLVCYCREVAGSPNFEPYMDEIVKLALKLLVFYFHEDVRIHAAEILEAVIKNFGIKPWHSYGICKAFINAIETDPDNTVIPELMDMYAKCIEHLLDTPDQIFIEDNLEKTFNVLGDYLKDHIEKTQDREARRKDQDHDDGDEEEMIEAAEEDEYLLNKIADIMHSIFGTQKENCLPLYENLHPYFVQLIDTRNAFSDRQWAICVFDDIIERCGPASLKYSGDFLKHLVNGINDQIAEIKQACAYGIGVLAKSCFEHNMHGTIYDQALTQAIEQLQGLIQNGINQRNKDSKIEDVEQHEFEVDVWENAVSAVGKVMRYKPDVLSMETGFDAWLDILDEAGGIGSDNEEAVCTMNWINDLLESNNSYIMAPERLVKIISIIGDTLVSGIMNDDGVETRNKSLAFIQSMINQNEAAFNDLISSWSDNKKFLLQDTLKDLSA